MKAAPDGTRHSELPLEGCPGRPRALRHLLKESDQKGHQLQRTDTESGQPLFFCVSCGAWALNKCQKLLFRCERKALRGSAGWDALRRIGRGQHPDYHGHRGERLATAWRHKTLEGARPPTPTSLRLFTPAPGSRLAALRERVKQRELARNGNGSSSQTTATTNFSAAP